MRAVRFELTHPKIPEPKSGALNHSAKLPVNGLCNVVTKCYDLYFESCDHIGVQYYSGVFVSCDHVRGSAWRRSVLWGLV